MLRRISWFAATKGQQNGTETFIPSIQNTPSFSLQTETAVAAHGRLLLFAAAHSLGHAAACDTAAVPAAAAAVVPTALQQSTAAAKAGAACTLLLLQAPACRCSSACSAWAPCSPCCLLRLLLQRQLQRQPCAWEFHCHISVGDGC